MHFAEFACDLHTCMSTRGPQFGPHRLWIAQLNERGESTQFVTVSLRRDIPASRKSPNDASWGTGSQTYNK